VEDAAAADAAEIELSSSASSLKRCKILSADLQKILFTKIYG
jgi:hypothetical protein